MNNQGLHILAPPGTGAPDTHVLAGLEWRGDHEAPDKAGAPVSAHLRWRGCRCDLRPRDITGLAGHGAALAQFCLGLEAAGQTTDGLWIFVAQVTAPTHSPHNVEGNADMQAPLWWLGATDHGAPSPIFAEEIHDTAADLVAALAAIAVLTDLGGIAMRPEARAMLQEALDRHGPDLPEPVTLVPAPLAERGPRVAVRKVPRLLPRLLATGMVLGLAATVWLGLDPGRVTPPEPLRVTWQAPLPGALAASCGKGLQTIWPRRAGWQFEAMGCARPGALPDGLEAAETAPRDLVIWRRYSRERAANAVLAGAAAEALLAEWQGKGLQTDQGDVLLWYSTELATEIINPDGAAPLDTMARLLAGAWASTPDAVTRETRDRLRVDVGDLPAEVFTRLEALRGRMAHGPEILSLTWSQGRTTVLLRPRTGEII